MTHEPKTSVPKTRIGLVEWFRPGEYERVETILADARKLGIEELRTGICWADWYMSEGDGWYAWLLPRLAQDVRILPCVLYTPPPLGIVPKFSSPPLSPKTYADFIDVMITQLGEYFDWIELWNRPNDPREWDSHLDPDWRVFSEMIGGAAYWIRSRGKKAVLPGMWPADLEWLNLMHQRGVLNYVDAVGIHGFPSSPEFTWRGWPEEVRSLRDRLARLGSHAEVWITQTGFSTWRGDERAQLRAFVEAVEAPVERMYWQEARDNDPEQIVRGFPRPDEREYHYGFKRADGTPKMLYRLWSEKGLDAVWESAQSTSRSKNSNQKKQHVLITGGAGFIGTNLAHRLLSSGKQVLIYDDLSRPGVDRNLTWLRKNHPHDLTIQVADVRDSRALQAAVRSAEQVFHFAAQVAVTTSLMDPRRDFDINVGGTLNLLEAIRATDRETPLLFTSTNKVYGELVDLSLQKNCTRYQPLDAALRTGINEERRLDFHSPYGCSKGAADQYVLDYARTFHIPAVVFRMSCIYGPHQMGTEDQGWVAHFLIRTLKEQSITLCGDGMQVRDLLFIDDLIDAFLLAHANIQTLSGQAFNIGGGLGNTISLLELLDMIGALHGEHPRVRMMDWRPGDQRYYVSDTRKFKAATGWAPKINVHLGIERLYHWLLKSYGLTSSHQPMSHDIPHAILTH